MSTIAEDKQDKKSQALRLSALPIDIRENAEKMNIDKDGDGGINSRDLGILLHDFLITQKDNNSLRKLVIYMGIFGIVLICAIFGVSVAAARLSKDTVVDSLTGTMYTKGSEIPVQTVPAMIRINDLNINEMDIDQLADLSMIMLDEGYLTFQVKGYAKSLKNNQVILSVEGGSLTFGADGLISATGLAETMLDSVSADDDAVTSEEGVRLLGGTFDLAAFFRSLGAYDNSDPRGAWM